jgi:hypothetical protein
LAHNTDQQQADKQSFHGSTGWILRDWRCPDCSRSASGRHVER